MHKQMPWSKFYWSDWARDPGLRASSYAAKGLWMDMLCQMDACLERGFLLIGNRPANAAEIAKLVGGERRTVERLLTELEANGVFSRDERGAIFSRRMTRDCDKSRRDIANGKLGGNPILKENKDLGPKVVNPGVKAEAEAEAEEEKKEVSTAPPSRADAPKVEPDPVEARDVEPVKPLDARDMVWSDGLMRLMAITGLSGGKARARMGQLLRDAGDDCAALHSAIRDCPMTKDPNAWLQRAALNIKARATGKSSIEQIRDDWNLPSFADPSLLADDFEPKGFLQ